MSSSSADSSKPITGEVLTSKESTEQVSDESKNSPNDKSGSEVMASKSDSASQSDTKEQDSSQKASKETPSSKPKEADADKKKVSAKSDDKKATSAPSKESKEKKPMSPALKTTLKWGGSLAVIVAAILYSRPDQDWQVQKINQLQQDYQALQEQHENLASMLEEQSATQSEQARVIVNLNNEMSRLIEESKTPLVDLTGLASQESVQKLQSQAQQQWQHLQQEIGSVVSQFNDKMASLIPQTTDERSEQESPSSAPVISTSPALMPATNLNNPLNTQQLQQWLLAINSQWMVSADAKATAEQLLAIEAAAGLSEFQQKALLSRSIGKDLAYLELYVQQQDAMPDTADLKAFVEALQLQTANIVTQTLQEELPTDEAADSSAWQTLIDKMSQMVTIQKREAAEAQTRVEAVLMQDVMRQRAMLWVDRMEWALQSQNQAAYDKAISDFSDYCTQNFSVKVDELELVLKPFVAYQFNQPKPLVVASLSELQGGAK